MACEQRGNARGHKEPRVDESRRVTVVNMAHGVELHDPGLGSTPPLWVLLSCPCFLERTGHRGAREGNLV